MKKQVLAFAICACLAWADHAAAAQPMTRQARACLAWDRQLDRMLDWSEQFNIHAAALRQSVRSEADRLRERCLRDISLASLNRYVMLMKMIYDDEQDEFESFD